MGAADRRQEDGVDWADDIADVRERLARLEERSEAHDRASAERRQQMLAAVGALETRLERVEGRAWKVALALAAGAGGAAGGLEIVKGLLGG